MPQRIIQQASKITEEEWKYPQQPYRMNGWLQVNDDPPLKFPHKIYYEE